MKTPLLDNIKEAGVKDVLLAAKGISGKGLNLLFGGMMGSYALGHLGEAAEKGPVGSESKALWESDVAKSRSMPEGQLREAKSRVGKGGLLGAATGVAATVPFALKHKNPFLPIAGMILGRVVGRGAAKKKYPSMRGAGPLDVVMSKYYATFSPEDRKQWLKIRNSSQVIRNPELQQQLAGLINTKMQAHPENVRWEKKKKLFGNIGKVLGAGTLLAAMLYGKKVHPGILGKARGALRGSTGKAYAALGLGATGLSIGSSLLGARRAGLSPKEQGEAVKRQVLSPETGLNLGFYSGAFVPKATPKPITALIGA